MIDTVLTTRTKGNADGFLGALDAPGSHTAITAMATALGLEEGPAGRARAGKGSNVGAHEASVGGLGLEGVRSKRKMGGGVGRT